MIKINPQFLDVLYNRIESEAKKKYFYSFIARDWEERE
jgi:hypothetical protein